MVLSPVTTRFSSKSRKKIVNRSEWKPNKAKTSCAAGKEYMSCRGKVIPEKQIYENSFFSEKCRLKCSENVILEMRWQLFHSFYSYDNQGKHKFLFHCIESYKPIQAKNIRFVSHRYFVTIKQQRITVCRTAILNIFDIKKTFLEKAQNAHKKGCCFPSPISLEKVMEADLK